MRKPSILPPLVALTLVVAAPALAAPPDPSQVVALNLAKEGLELFKQARYEGALDRFQTAAKLYHAPTIVLYAARSQRKLGRLAEAEALYAEIVAEPIPKDATPPFLEAHHEAEVELAEVRGLRNAKEPAAPPNSPKPTALEAQPSPPGQPIQTKGPAWPGYATIGLGIVGLGIGAATGFASIAKVNQLADNCPSKACSPTYGSLADDAKTMGNVSTAAFVVGGVFAAAGITLVVLRPGARDDRHSHATLLPTDSTQTVDTHLALGVGRADLVVTF